MITTKRMKCFIAQSDGSNSKKTALRSFFNTILKKYVVHAIYLSFTTLLLKVVYGCGYYIIRSVRYYTQKEET